MSTNVWWQEVVVSGPEVRLSVLASRLGLSLLAGMTVAWLYRATRNGSGAPSLPATLVLLAVLIAAVTQVIGDSVARAFSLVGALSIVRFRTVVRDTRDTAFVIFSVIVGMAVGAGHSRVALIACAITGLAAWLMRPGMWGDSDASEMDLTLKIGIGQDPEALAAELFRQHLGSREIIGVSTARQGSSLEYHWRVVLAPTASAAELVRALNRLDGVQDVELKHADPDR